MIKDINTESKELYYSKEVISHQTFPGVGDKRTITYKPKHKVTVRKYNLSEPGIHLYHTYGTLVLSEENFPEKTQGGIGIEILPSFPAVSSSFIELAVSIFYMSPEEIYENQNNLVTCAYYLSCIEGVSVLCCEDLNICYTVD